MSSSSTRSAVAAPAPFPFFVGAGRSGTTLLRSIFNAHPDMTVLYEAHFIAAMARRRRHYQRTSGFRIKAFLEDLYADGKFRRIGIPQELVREALDACSPHTFSEAVRAVLRAAAHHNGKQHYADKTPGYVLRLRLLAKLFPEARFVHIIRDGRDVAVAFEDVPFGPKDVHFAAIYWRRHVNRGRRAGRILGPERYREIHYESLVDDPERSVRELCDFIDLKFDASMLRYFEDPPAAVLATGHPQNHQRLLLPPTKGLRDWRREMPPENVESFEAIAGRSLRRFGYELTTTRPSLTARLGAIRAESRWQAWRIRYKVSKRTGALARAA